MEAMTRTFTYVLILTVGSRLSMVKIHSSDALEQTGKIAGMVLDENEARIVNAGITVTNGRSTYHIKSDDTGEFSLNVPPGDYRMKISAAGFRAYSAAPFSLGIDDTRTFKVT